MENIKKHFDAAQFEYNRKIPHLSSSCNVVVACLEKLSFECRYQHFGSYRGRRNIINYNAFYNGAIYSRPIRSEFFILNINSYKESLKGVVLALESNQVGKNVEVELTKVIYTSVMAFASVIDMWKRGSRKTPGTFFEVFIAALMQKFIPTASFSKHIQLNSIAGVASDYDSAEEISRLSTDLVVSNSLKNKNAVVPMKITTRERIVQPFVHQRILDSAFGPNVYESFLACISETQMDILNGSVNQICVPGTIKLFKKYLGDISTIYYCDIPERYDEPDIQKLIPVKQIGCIFNDIKNYLELDT